MHRVYCDDFLIICVGKCLKHVNVIAGDSRDNKKGRFFIFSPTSHLFPSKWKPDSWYPSYAYYPLHDVSFEIHNTKMNLVIERLIGLIVHMDFLLMLRYSSI